MVLRTLSFAACIGRACAGPLFQPEQVHLSLGASESEFRVQWSTVGQESLPQHAESTWVIYGQNEQAVAGYQTGELPKSLAKGIGTSILMHLETDSAGEACRESFPASCVARSYTTHWANMTGLDLGATYFYKVGSHQTGYSWKVYRFSTRGTKSDKARPLTYAVYGDMGDYNGQARPMLQHLAEEGRLDMVLHLGDFAYDIRSDDGRNGDRYFRDMEDITANMPYMVCSGNHESSQNWNQYTQRFQLMPSNSGYLPAYPQFGARASNNWWFSFQTGYMYVIMVKSTIYGYANPGVASPEQKEWELLRKMQYEWLEKELAVANTKRDESPWLVIGTHHAMYCSGNTDDCRDGAANLREGVRPVGSPEETPREYGLEKLFYKAGVDLVLYGHCHNYERYFDMSPKWNASDPVSSGVTTQSTRNPPAPIYITTGAAGNVELLLGYDYPDREAIAYRRASYSWTNMQVFNTTHIRWQQVQTDNTRPPEEMGQVIDDAWFIQEKHGPRAEPRAWKLEELATGKPQQAPFGERVGQLLEGLEDFVAERVLDVADAGCLRTQGKLKCDAIGLERDGMKFGQWQATAKVADRKTHELHA